MEIGEDYIYTGVCAFGVLSLAMDPSLWRGTHRTGVGGPIVGVPRRPMLFAWEQAAEDVVGTSAVALFSNRDQIYRKSPLTDRGESTDWVWVRPEITAEAVAEFDPSAAEEPDQSFRLMHGPAGSRALSNLRLLTSVRPRIGMCDPIALDELAVTIVRGLVGSAYIARGARPIRRSATARAHADAVNDASELIASRFADRIGLDDAAKAACMSPLHFCRIFKERTGATVHAYLSRIRVAEAMERLADDDSSHTAIAMSCGFASSSHMSDVFKRATGLRPSDAKRAVRSGIPARLRAVPHRSLGS